MAFHGCPVSDCDVSDHDHCFDREIVQKTALGMYRYICMDIPLFSHYLTTYIIDQKMCTLYPYKCDFIRRKLIYLYGGIHMYIRGPKRISNYVQFNTVL